MCLYPTFVKNPKNKPNKKNKGKPPVCWDRRLYYIPTKCGCCIECRKEKQREWRVRLDEELRSNFVYFLLFFSITIFQLLCKLSICLFSDLAGNYYSNRHASS